MINMRTVLEFIIFIVVSLLDLALMRWLMVTFGQSALQAALLLVMALCMINAVLVLLAGGGCDPNSSLHPVFVVCFALLILHMAIMLLTLVATMSAAIAYSLTSQ
jgi:hypothetical protein